MISYFSLEWANEQVRSDGRHTSMIVVIDCTKRKIGVGELTRRGDTLFYQEGPLQAYASSQFSLLLENILENTNGAVKDEPLAINKQWIKIKVRHNNGRIQRLADAEALAIFTAELRAEIQMLLDCGGINKNITLPRI